MTGVADTASDRHGQTWPALLGRLLAGDDLEAAGIAEVLAAADAGEVDLAILDGEAQPTGGMGVSRQLKNEIDDCPPIIVTVRRQDDRWLATWSLADAVLVHPLDPLTAAETVADVLRRAQAGDSGSDLAVQG